MLALGASTSHLGRPLRAWRALANPRRSWLSREVWVASTFLALASASLLAPPGWGVPRPLAWLAVVAGAGLCAAIDGVYRAVPRLSPARLHGGEPTLAALFLLALIAGAWPVAAALGVLRSLLAVRRLRAGGAGLPAVGVAARLTLLAVACIPALPWQAAAVVALAGEVLDRCDLIAGLEPTSPASVLVMQVASAAGQRTWPLG